MLWLCVKYSSGGMAEIDNVVVVEAADQLGAKERAGELLKLDKWSRPSLHVSPFDDLRDGWLAFT